MVAGMRNMPWDAFHERSIKRIFDDKELIIDIGGGLRVAAEKNNRGNQNAALADYIFSKKRHYKVLDKVADYKPDIVGDIHELPLESGSVDAVICIAVLEHVEEPQKAVREMYRVLKPGGYCYIYVPFLYYYHPMPGYYGDFYRFTFDGLQYMTRDFKDVEIQNVRGAIATAMNLFPFFSKRTGLFDRVDALAGKLGSKQTSGYNVFCVK